MAQSQVGTTEFHYLQSWTDCAAFWQGNFWFGLLCREAEADAICHVVQGVGQALLRVCTCSVMTCGRGIC